PAHTLGREPGGGELRGADAGAVGEVAAHGGRAVAVVVGEQHGVDGLHAPGAQPLGAGGGVEGQGAAARAGSVPTRLAGGAPDAGQDLGPGSSGPGLSGAAAAQPGGGEQSGGGGDGEEAAQVHGRLQGGKASPPVNRPGAGAASGMWRP